MKITNGFFVLYLSFGLILFACGGGSGGGGGTIGGGGGLGIGDGNGGGDDGGGDGGGTASSIATSRLSVSSSGAQGNSISSTPSISSDGRFVAFESIASNLTADDTNGAIKDIFVRDRNTNETTRVSVSHNGDAVNGASSAPSISSDGRYVAFESDATNLVAGDTRGLQDIFVHDRDFDGNGIFDETGIGQTAIIRVSVDSDGNEAIGGASSAPSISSDGRYVAFESDATNLVDGDTRGLQDIFVHDRDADGNGIFDETGTGQTATIRVSVDSDGNEATGGNSSAPSISLNGRYVVFESLASNLVDGDTRGLQDIFVHDRDADGNGIFDETGIGQTATIRVSFDSDGNEAIGGNSSAPSISSDGRYVAFESDATNLVDGDTRGLQDIFVHDRDSDGNSIFDETGIGQTATIRVSFDSDGNEAIGGNSSAPSISSDGRYVAFESDATNLVAGDTRGLQDIFVHDRDSDGNSIFDETGIGQTATIRVSVDSEGNEAAGGNSSAPSISSDGKHVAFESIAANLVTDDTNGLKDIFVNGP